MMQIDEIILYHHDGRQRSISFVPGALNIITGQSARGKSSLINIIRYLLVASSPHFPSGPIQEKVAWVGGRFRVADNRVFVGRPSPKQGSETSAAMLLVGATGVPPFSSLEPNTTIGDVCAYLGALVGIEENLHLPPSGNSRAPLAANLKHALYYCFQSQGEIANPDLLFHHQNREFQAQAIRDTLPYFLGAQDADELRRREQLSDLRRQQRQCGSRLRTVVEEAESGLGPTASLVAEARRAGLLSNGEIPASLDESRRLMRQALEVSMPTVAAPQS